MVPPEKLKNALNALNGVLVQARMMAFEGAPHKELAKVLDVAEYLPMLLIEKDDVTAQFRAQLEGLVQMNEAFGFALQRFDETS
jgi:hypothetical protein